MENDDDFGERCVCCMHSSLVDGLYRACRRLLAACESGLVWSTHPIACKDRASMRPTLRGYGNDNVSESGHKVEKVNKRSAFIAVAESTRLLCR